MPDSIEKGEKLFLYTDGIPEAMNIIDEEYSDDRMIDFVKDHSNEDPQQFIKMIVEDVKKFTDEAQQSDDITSIYLKRL